MLSVCIYEKNNDVTLTNAHFIKIQHEMIEIVERIGQLEKDCGLSEENIMTKEKNIHVGFMEIAEKWCKGMTFSELMKGCSLDEGFVVNQLLRTEMVCRRLADIAQEIGNPELFQTCQMISQAMLRDIVYTPSLYLNCTLCFIKQTNRQVVNQLTNRQAVNQLTNRQAVNQPTNQPID